MSFLRALQTSARYRLDEKIATGGYGEVWRATDVLLGRTVAVKQLPPDRARNEQTVIRFRAEAQRAGSLGHENITRVYDYVEPAPPDPPFLVMELVDGPSVAQVLACGALHPAQAMSVVAEAAAGLQAAHEAGFVHRDVKPANLLLTGAGQVKVTDFGVSYAINSMPMTSSNTLLGTPGYVAPERLTGGGVTAAADLYALGIVAWECLTGHPPFRGTPIEVVVAHRDQPLPSLPASVPAEVTALVTELAAKDPAGRPASAGQVARRAAGLRDRLARESGVSANPLAGPWSRAGRNPSGPVGTSTVPSDEVDLFKRAFDRPPRPAGPPQPEPPEPPEPALAARAQPGLAPEQPAPTTPPPEPPRARRRARWLRPALAAAAVALIATGLTVTRLTGAGTRVQPPPGSPGQRSPGASATPHTGGHHTGPSPAGRPPAGAATGPGPSTTTPQTSRRLVGTVATVPAATGSVTTGPVTASSRPAATASASASATSSPPSTTVDGKGKGKGNGNGQGNGPGNGNGNGNGQGNGNGNGNGKGNG